MNRKKRIIELEEDLKRQTERINQLVIEGIKREDPIGKTADFVCFIDKDLNKRTGWIRWYSMFERHACRNSYDISAVRLQHDWGSQEHQMHYDVPREHVYITDKELDKYLATRFCTIKKKAKKKTKK